jgi:asparagine synthase (glutamine-hydrolysing)
MPSANACSSRAIPWASSRCITFILATSFFSHPKSATLLRTGLVPRQLDPHGLYSFLAFGSVYEPRTIIEGISAVPPGHIVSVVRFGRAATSKRADFRLHSSALGRELKPTTIPLAKAPEAAVRALPDLLRNAVLSHLVSDVPVGVFLSGGIDSSSLVAVMSQAGIRATDFFRSSFAKKNSMKPPTPACRRRLVS